MISKFVKFAIFTAVGYVSLILAGLCIGAACWTVLGFLSLDIDILTLDDFGNMLRVSMSDEFAVLRLAISAFIALAVVRADSAFAAFSIVKTSAGIGFIKSLAKTVALNAAAMGVALLITVIVA